jgi:hypothetical protein
MTATTSNAFVQGYAYSEIDENIRVAVPSMVEQVKTWIQSAGPARASKDNEDTLFVLEAGINDGWAKPSLDPTNVVERGQQTCLNLLTGVGKLVNPDESKSVRRIDRCIAQGPATSS